MSINGSDRVAHYATASTSSEFLRTFVGSRVVNLIRYSWWPKEAVSAECGIDNQQVFSLTAGPVSIIFEDGRRLCVASDPASNSVCVWLEVSPSDAFSGTTREFDVRLLEDDPEMFPISAIDAEYAAPFWAGVVGARLAKLAIVKQKAEFLSARQASHPSERGLCFVMDNGARFIASHGLHDMSDDFSVIEHRSIHESLRPQLEEVAL